MIKKTIFLIASVIFFPLNNLPSYANDASSDMHNISKPFLFDIDNTENPVKCYTDCFQIISDDAMRFALTGYAVLDEAGKINKKGMITIIDFSKPSTEERLFVIDLKTKKVIARSLCAHGKNSGEVWAEKFSNNAESYQSSLGFYIANETYDGKNGFSLKLDGEETGINDNARNRGVVIHGADYVSNDFIANNGKIGRSQGCPALPMDKYKKIIHLIEGGSCLFIYHPNKYYKTHSPILKHYNESCLTDLITEFDK